MPDTIDVGVVALVQPPATAAVLTSYTPTLSVKNNTPSPLYLQGTLEIRDSRNILVYSEPISATGQIAAGATAPLSATRAWTPLVAGAYSVRGTVYAGASDVSGSVAFGPYPITAGAVAPPTGRRRYLELTIVHPRLGTRVFYIDTGENETDDEKSVETIRYPNYL